MNAFRTACPMSSSISLRAKIQLVQMSKPISPIWDGSEGGRTGSESSGGGANGNPRGYTTDGVEPRQLDAVRWAFERSEM